ncbi:MAG: radical SAM protein [Gemmatimonadaceae bacterium]
MQPSLLPADASAWRRYPAPRSLDSQKDIRYFGSHARGVLNGPETTGMQFWSINPYVGCAFGCAYCYARHTHRQVTERAVTELGEDADASQSLLELPDWLAFERRIFVKRNAATVLRTQLASTGPRIARLLGGETLLIGTATDPYQPAERRYRITREILEVLAMYRALCVRITTKSSLVVRDIDVLARVNSRSQLTVHISLITTDRELARRIEPRAPTPDARLRAMRRLTEAGIDVGVNIMPILPGISDGPEMLRALLRRVADAGVSHVHACALRLQPAARKRYLPFIVAEFPALATRYHTAYAEDSHMSERYTNGLLRFMARASREVGLPFHTLGRNESEEPEGSVPTGASADPGSSGADLPVVQDGTAGMAAPQLELTL